jgi:ribosome-associated protein
MKSERKSIARNERAEDADDTEADGKPSKSQRKRDMHELQSLGERLVELSAEQLASVEMPEDLREAVREAVRVKSHEGRRRQMQYIGRLMREVDPAPIRERLAAWEGRSHEQTAREHELVRWRERLMEDESALTELASRCPGMDLQHLRGLVRNARAERDAGRAPKSYRELFRVLRGSLFPANAASPEAD